MKKKIILFAVLIFLLNLFYEVLHSVLYDWNKSPLLNDVYFYVSKILFSTSGDLFLIFIIIALISFYNKKISWINNPTRKDYILITLFGITISVLIELRAFYYGKWNYLDVMPTIFGIGITPLFQLVITTYLALWIMKL